MLTHKLIRSLLFLVLAAPVASSQPRAELFSFPTEKAVLSDNSGSAFLIDIRADVLEQAPGELWLPLGKSETLLVRDGYESRDRGAVWRGRLEFDPSSRVTLTVHHGLISGWIASSHGTWEIRPIGNGRHLLIDIDETAVQGCGGAVSPDTEPHKAGAPTVKFAGVTPRASTNPVDEIQLLSVYTATARSAAGGTSAIQAAIQGAVDRSNTAFIDSNMDARFILAHTAEVSYAESGNGSTDLSWVRTNSTVASLRNTHDADMVSLIVNSASGICGIGYLQTSPASWFANWAFQVTKRSCLGGFTFAHEHGHNMGFAHDPANADPPASQSYVWSFGHFVSGSYRTVMSYSNQCSGGCSSVGHFSNPDINHNGVPTGIANQRDNARTGDLTAPIVTDFRIHSSSSSPVLNVTQPSVSFTATEGAGNPGSQTVQVSNTGGATLSWTASDNAGWLSVSPTSGSLSAGQTTSAAISVNISGLSPGNYNGTVSFGGDGGTDSVSVSLTVNAAANPSINVPVSSLSFTTTEGSSPGSQTIQVQNSGTGTLNWSVTDNASWLSANPTSGSLNAGQTASVTVSVSSASANPGNYNASLSFSSNGGNDSVGVSLAVNAATNPTISVPVSSLSYTTTEGSSPGSQTIQVQNSGTGTLNWSVTDNASWLSANPTSGSLNAGQSANVTVSVSSASANPGNYNGNLSFSSNGGSDSVAVSLAVNAAASPTISVPVSSLSYSTTAGSSPGTQTIQVQNSGTGTLNWSLSDNASWLSANPASGSLNAGQSAPVTVSVASSSLNPGNYNGNVSFSSNGGSDSVSVSLSVTAAPEPLLTVPTATLSYSGVEGGANPPGKQILVRNDGDAALNWSVSDSANWLFVNTPSGSLNPGQQTTLTVSVNTAGLSAGNFSNALSFSSNGGSATVPVTLAVTSAPTPIIGLTTAALAFSGLAGGANPGAQQFVIRNDGAGTLSWSLSDTASWLSTNVTSGSLGAGQVTTITAFVNSAGLNSGNYVGTIFFTSNGGSASVRVDLALTSAPQGILSVPFQPIAFTASAGGSNPPQYNLTVTNSGAGPLTWSVSENAAWLSTNTQGLTLNPGQSVSVKVIVNVAGLSAGTYNSNLIFSSNGGGANVLVTLNVNGETTTTGFVDVSDSAFYADAVRIMRDRNITSGCASSPARYCPNANVTRGQMAVFIVRAMLGGDSFSFNANPTFSDVPASHPFFKWIQKFAELGITSGCAPGRFCPNSPVNRGQMAVFLIRMRLGSNTAFLVPPGTMFSDVAVNHPFGAWIQELGESKITTGCGAGRYCPGAAVTRGQMALFIVRAAFNLEMPGAAEYLASSNIGTLDRGQSATIRVTGQNTNFSGASTVVPQAGITVTGFRRINATTAEIDCAVASNAAVGPRSLIIRTGTNEAALPNGLVIQ